MMSTKTANTEVSMQYKKVKANWHLSIYLHNCDIFILCYHFSSYSALLYSVKYK